MNDNIIIIKRQDAKNINLRYYYTGKECIHGHIDYRYTISGKCLTCQKKQSKQWNSDHNEEIVLKAKSPEAKKRAKAKYEENYIKNHTYWLWKGLKSKSKRKNIPFIIEVKDIIIPENCPILGIKLVINKSHGKDDSPSVDRIIPSLGYIPSNIIVISYRANKIKNNATIDELEKIYNFYHNLQSRSS